MLPRATSTSQPYEVRADSTWLSEDHDTLDMPLMVGESR